MNKLFWKLFVWITDQDRTLTISDSEDGYNFACWERGNWTACYHGGKYETPHRTLHYSLGKWDILYMSHLDNAHPTFVKLISKA